MNEKTQFPCELFGVVIISLLLLFDFFLSTLCDLSDRCNSKKETFPVKQGPCGVIPAEEYKGNIGRSTHHVLRMSGKFNETVTEECLQSKGFCKSVIENILRPKKRNTYSNVDIGEAVMLRSISTKAYNTLRHKKMTLKPLPAINTLNRRIRHFTCPPGIQHDLFSLIKLKLSTVAPWEQQTVLMFDEVHLKDSCDFSERLKRLFIHQKKAQVVMLR